MWRSGSCACGAECVLCYLFGLCESIQAIYCVSLKLMSKCDSERSPGMPARRAAPRVKNFNADVWCAHGASSSARDLFKRRNCSLARIRRNLRLCSFSFQMATAAF